MEVGFFFTRCGKHLCNFFFFIVIKLFSSLQVSNCTILDFKGNLVLENLRSLEHKILYFIIFAKFFNFQNFYFRHFTLHSCFTPGQTADLSAPTISSKYRRPQGFSSLYSSFSSHLSTCSTTDQVRLGYMYIVGLGTFGVLVSFRQLNDDFRLLLNIVARVLHVINEFNFSCDFSVS